MKFLKILKMLTEIPISFCECHRKRTGRVKWAGDVWLLILGFHVPYIPQVRAKCRLRVPYMAKRGEGFEISRKTFVHPGSSTFTLHFHIGCRFLKGKLNGNFRDSIWNPPFISSVFFHRPFNRCLSQQEESNQSALLLFIFFSYANEDTAPNEWQWQTTTSDSLRTSRFCRFQEIPWTEWIWRQGSWSNQLGGRWTVLTFFKKSWHTTIHGQILPGSAASSNK